MAANSGKGEEPPENQRSHSKCGWGFTPERHKDRTMICASRQDTWKPSICREHAPGLPGRNRTRFAARPDVRVGKDEETHGEEEEKVGKEGRAGGTGAEEAENPRGRSGEGAVIEGFV